MFGYVTADPSQLGEAEIQRYSGCYCGLCRFLKEKHGFKGRMTLTYDMTFLVLVLSSLYEPEETHGAARCPVHPLKQRPYVQTKYTEYGADLNLLLAYYNCMDDWEDEKKLSRRAMAAMLKDSCEEIEMRYPRQSKAVVENLEALRRYEDGPEADADEAAGCFGRLMGELFVPNETDYWAPTLRKLGEGLGRFIYIMDACIDYRGDEKHHRPNPLKNFGGEARTREGDRELLTMLLSDAVTAFEHLPLEQDLTLLRNILYAGVWQRYDQFFYRQEKHKETSDLRGQAL